MWNDTTDKIKKLYADACSKLCMVQTIEGLSLWYDKYLSKDGVFRCFLREELLVLNNQDHKICGCKLVNEFVDDLTTKMDLIKQTLIRDKIKNFQVLQDVSVDLDLGSDRTVGREHPIGFVARKILSFFDSLGFVLIDDGEIQTDYYNFDALNFPDNHIAKSMQDTFYVNSSRGILLRTHTTSGDIKALQTFALRGQQDGAYVSFGRCYRNEDVSARSHMFFHQIDGIQIGVNLTVSDLISVIKSLCRYLFDDVKIKIRSSYFPFVAPGYEVDISCVNCLQQGCNLCKYTGWLEILGCGLLHSNVLKQAFKDNHSQYIDYNVCAFGLGIERIVMLLYGISDLRILYTNTICV